jgi:hypothetical protein
MKPRVRCLLRRCENPACGVLFHPAREASRFCRVCSNDKRNYAKGAHDGRDSRRTP